MVRQGAIDVQSKPPFVMGFESAGEVESVAADVTSIRVGDRVIAFMESKAWSELVTCNAKHVYKLPKNMEYQEAIAVTSNYVVAYALLFDFAFLRPGQTVLIHSVGGGVVSYFSLDGSHSLNLLITVLLILLNNAFCFWSGHQGQALAQLARSVKDVTLIGTASKHKHDQIKDSVNHLLDHASDYVTEARK
jgi:hypothetical protein